MSHDELLPSCDCANKSSEFYFETCNICTPQNFVFTDEFLQDAWNDNAKHNPFIKEEN